jgi:hypothetical protein
MPIQTVECAICAAYGIDGTTAADTAIEIPYDRARDGGKRRRVHACRDCVRPHRTSIRDLRDESTEAGDRDLAATCQRALQGDREAMAACLRVLARLDRLGR